MVWGGIFFAGSSAMRELDVVHVTLARYALSALVTSVILLAVEGRRSFRTEGRGLALVVLGSVGYCGFNLGSFAMVGPLPAQNVSVLIATMPLVTAVVTWVAGGGRPRPLLAVSAVVALLGVATVLGKGSPTAVLDGAVGLPAVVVVLAVLSWVIYTRGAARFPAWSPLRYTTLSQLGGVVMLLVIAFVAETAGWIGAPRLSAYLDVWPALLYLALPGSVYAVLAWNSAARRLGPPTTSLFISLVPVTALVVTAVNGGEVVPGQLVGVALVLVGLVLGVVSGMRRTGAASEQAAGRVAGRATGQVAAPTHDHGAESDAEPDAEKGPAIVPPVPATVEGAR
nr:hypothetical protein GCM10020241_53580 [Streptoalloteichus tenebrarius]